MTATYTTRNRWTKQAIGSNTNTWGDVLNLVFDLMDASDDGVTTVSQTTPYTLTTANGATDEARRRVIRYTGATASTITIPAVEKVYLVDAVTADCTITNGSNSVTVPGGMSSLIYTNGTLMRTIQNRWFANQRITGVASPTVSTDAANKGYVDSQAFEAAAGNLPGQPGNAGKFLTTDGANASWASTEFVIGSLTITSGSTTTAGDFRDAIDVSDKIYQVGDVLWTARTPGSDYLLCDGSSYPRTTYPALSALMPDGRNALTTLTQRTLSTVSAAWAGVAHGAGVFVAICPSSFNWVRSADGATWTSFSSPNSGANWTSIAFGNSTFVAVANGTVGASSADGVTWTSRTLPANKSWSHIAFGNGAFLALSTNSGASNAATTENGVTWTSRTSPGQAYTDLIFGNGVFVALRSGAIDTTADGVTWTTITPGFTLNKIAYANGIYVGFTNSSTSAYISTDLLDWRLAPTSLTSAPQVMASGNGLFFAFSGGSGLGTWSVNGIDWRLGAASLAGSAPATAATYGAGVFVVVLDTDPDSSVAVSTNNILDATKFVVPDLLQANSNEKPYIRAVA